MSRLWRDILLVRRLHTLMVARAHFESTPRATSDTIYGLCQADKVVAERKLPARLPIGLQPVEPPLASFLRLNMMSHLRMAMRESETIAGLVVEHPGWPE